MSGYIAVQHGTLGAALRTLRNDRGLTLKQVDDLSGIELSTLSNWETGNHAPNVNKLGVLLRVYGMQVFIGPESGDGDDAADGGL